VDTSTPLVRRPTQCRICGHTFPGNSLATATIIGSNPQAKMKQIEALVTPLMKHMAKHHKQELAWSQSQGGQLSGLLALNFIQCDDPEVLEVRDRTRWTIFRQMMRVWVTDERIAERLHCAILTAVKDDLGPEEAARHARGFLESKLGQEILVTMREMRDALSEHGRYPTQTPPVVVETKPAENTPETASGA
jgi:hypothetical protein